MRQPRTRRRPVPRAGNGRVRRPAAPSELSQAIASPKALSAAEAAALTAAFKAVDDGRYADARAAVANFNNPLLTRIVDWTVLRTAPRSDADFASTWRFLRENPDWPEPEVLRRQAEDRIVPGTPPREVWRYFTAFPPLTSAGHMRRLEAASVANAVDVPRFASESWRSATFRKADEEDFLNKYGRYLSGEDQIARFDRILREWPCRGRARSRAQAAAGLPAARQCAAGDGHARGGRRDPAARRAGREAGRAGDQARTARAGCAAPASSTKPRRSPCSRRPTQTEAWWNERQQLARDLLAAGHPAEAYAVTVPHGQTKGVAFAEAEFLAGWIALRRLKKTADGLKHFQTLYDGAPTDVARSRGAYWLGRAHETAGHSKEATDWFGRAAAFGQTFYGQLAARHLPGGARQMPSDPATTPADQEALAGRELVAVARYHRPGRRTGAHAALPAAARAPGDHPGRDPAAGRAGRRAQAARRGARHRATGDGQRRHPVRRLCSRSWTSAPPDRSSGRWRLP